MKVTNDELLDILEEVSSRLFSQVRIAYKSGTLDKYLDSIGMLDVLVKEDPGSIHQSDPSGRILIIGDSQLKEREILGCLKEYGLTKDRVELHLGYEESKRFNYSKLQYNPSYRLILFGPVPHSVNSKEDASSIISKLQGSEGYPKVVCLKDDHELKITKTGLRRAILQEIDSGYIEVH